jgi:phosphoribosylamine--glycine ligase
MNVLIIGSGGREHALAWKLAQSPDIQDLLIAPGNAGTSRHGRNVPVNADQPDLLLEIARHANVDLVVIGPEAPLVAGLADRFAAAGIAVFGPSAAAAQIEGSKIFAKELMQEAGVPTAAAHSFENAADAIEFARLSGRRWVVKADGLAAGKGVIVPESAAATLAAIEEVMATAAGRRVLLEELLEGEEVSVLALCDGERLLPLPPARDHKRLRDGDQGPNTGGMGAFAPADLDEETFEAIVGEMMLPVVRTLAARGTPFRGALYAGVMLTASGPRILEFNARFGDPETQVILPLLEGDFLAALAACAAGKLGDIQLGWARRDAACVVLAAAGYPAAPRANDPIRGLESVAELADVLVFHAGTAWENSEVVTAGGRVLCVAGLGASRAAALSRAYEAIDVLSFDGMQFRSDIGR